MDPRIATKMAGVVATDPTFIGSPSSLPSNEVGARGDISEDLAGSARHAFGGRSRRCDGGEFLDQTRASKCSRSRVVMTSAIGCGIADSIGRMVDRAASPLSGELGESQQPSRGLRMLDHALSESKQVRVPLGVGRTTSCSEAGSDGRLS